MLSRIIYNFRDAKHYKGNLLDKLTIFYTLFRLQIKSKLLKTENAVVQESFLGYRICGYSHATICQLFDEVFISNEYFFNSSSQNPIIIDCGANIGMSVLYFKKLYPESKIIAFEANPNAFELLEKNMAKNEITNVELLNVALFDKETEISFFIGNYVGTLLGSIRKERGGGTELKVKTQKLSHFLKSIETIDLIKIDIEGAEQNVVSDLIESSTLSKAKEYIIEYHHNMNEESKLSAFLQKFESHGFNYNIKANFSQINSFQDLLIHFYKK